MSKKIKILIVVISTVLLLSIGGTAKVLAQSPSPSTTQTPNVRPSRPDINAQVAQILGITEAQFTDALKQARTALIPPTTPVAPATPSTKPVRPAPIKTADLYAKVAQILNKPTITGDSIAAAYKQAEKEIRDQATNTALDNAQKNGKITLDEENQIKQWLQNRPAALDKLGMPFGPGSIAPNMQGKFPASQDQSKNSGRKFGGPKPTPSTK
jgi:hypothetical protein